MQIDSDVPLNLDQLAEIKLNAGEGFLALGLFLNRYAQRVEPEAALAILCTDVEVEADKTSADPAAMSDWADCVRAVLEGKI